jgi:hypothetical protein
MDKLPIIASPLGGYSLLPESEYMIGYMNQDGTVNWDKLNILLQQISNHGAWGWREFPPWPTNHPEWEYIRPFHFDMNGNKLDIIWNDLYFENLSKIFHFAWEQYNLVPIFDLFNGSEARVLGKYRARENSPWRVFTDHFYGNDAIETRHQWIDKILNAAANVPIWVQLCNEPGPAAKHKAENMLSDTLDYLLKNKFLMGRIITGLDEWKKKTNGGYGKMYRRWREKAINLIADLEFYQFPLSDETKDEINIKYIKKTMWTPVHAMNLKSLTDFITHGVGGRERVPSGGSRNLFLSTDGRRPDYFETYKMVMKFIDNKGKLINYGKAMVELIAGKENKENKKNPIEYPYGSLHGAAQAIKEKLEKPENMEHFPKPLPIPSWVYDNPEEKKSITITSPTMDDGEYYQPGSQMNIKWESTGDIKKVMIEYLGEKPLPWQYIMEIKNNGHFQWGVEIQQEGIYYIRVVDADPNSLVHDIQGFRVKHAEPEKRKMTLWQWLKKSHRLIIGGVVIIGTIIAVSIKWWWVIPGVALQHALWHFKIFKK